MATDQIFVYTMNRGVQGGAWSRYIFPFTVEYFSHLGDYLYMREGDNVWRVVQGATNDGGTPFLGVIQWPWLDFDQPGVTKQLLGFDIVGTGTSSIEVGYSQTNFGTFTTSHPIPVDSYPGQIIPLPIMAPSMSIRLTYDGDQAWEWNAFDLYLQDQRPSS